MVAVSRPPTSPPRSRRLRRLVPLLVLAAGAFAGGVIAGARHEPSERRLANRFAQAWEREQYADMYAMLTPRARSETSLRALRSRVPPGGRDGDARPRDRRPRGGPDRRDASPCR